MSEDGFGKLFDSYTNLFKKLLDSDNDQDQVIGHLVKIALKHDKYINELYDNVIDLKVENSKLRDKIKKLEETS